MSRAAAAPTRRPGRRAGFAVALLAAAALAVPPAAAHDLPSHTYPPGFVPPSLPSGGDRVVSTAQVPRFYIGNDDHTDYMWSGSDAAYTQAFANMLEYYMTQAEATSSFGDAQGRFNCDGTVWISEYERTHKSTQVQRLFRHIRDGTITVPLNTLVELYGAMPTEAVIRSFEYGGRLERRLGMRLSMVIPMENQTLPGGVASLWAGSGAQFAWKGVCNCATPVDVTQRPRQIYRFTGHDGRSVVLKWQSFQDSRSLGGYAEAYVPSDAVARMQANPLWPWDVAAAFGYGWDSLQTTTSLFVTTSQSLSNASQRVIVSNETDFFRDFTASHPEALAAYGASFGNDWDLLASSIGEVSAAMRRSVEKWRTADALATIASIYDPNFMRPLVASRDSAELALGLYYDHSFSPGPAITADQRNAWERRMQAAVQAYVDELHADGLVRLGQLVPVGGRGERHVVFNALSWRRTDAVDLATSVAPPLRVIDVGTGAEVPSQPVTVNGRALLRILARGVPPVGYRVYEVQSGVGQAFAASATVALPSMDNGTYGVTLDGGGRITSLVDHRVGAELTAAPINDLGGAGSGAVTVLGAGPVSTTLQVSAGGVPAHDAQVTLYAPEIDRVDVENHVTSNFGDIEAYAFPFALPGMTMRHEEVGMIAQVGRLAQGGDYADEDTRTDWLTLNHFVDLSQPTFGVTLSSWDSPFFQAGNSTPATLDAATPTVRCVVGMPGFGPSIQGQGGDSFFRNRFALRSHGPWDPAAAMRLALEHQNPLVETPVTGKSGRVPADTFSVLALDPPDVLLWALKPAEDPGAGIIARVWNVAGDVRATTLTLPPYGIQAPMHTTHVETDLRRATIAGGAVLDTLAREQIETYRLNLATTVDTTPAGLPADVALAAFPNPLLGLHAPATVAYTLMIDGHVRVTIHDVTGATVATLVDGASTAGTHLETWDGRWNDGRDASPGVYFVRVEGPRTARSVKLVRL